MFLLDTNAVIHYFKRQGRIAERLLGVAPDAVALPSVALFELTVGMLRSDNPERRRAQLELFLATVRVLPFGSAEASAAAQIRTDLEAQGFLSDRSTCLSPGPRLRSTPRSSPETSASSAGLLVCRS